jgi:predicted DNA-binding protein YlxM (UPF0122 family)
MLWDGTAKPIWAYDVPVDIESIRFYHSRGFSIREIAKTNGVSKSLVSKILNNKEV